MQHPDQTMAEIAATLGVSRSTLYRALRPKS
nr:helix-turn-helix domain-containing protein [Brevundimonas sp.]